MDPLLMQIFDKIYRTDLVYRKDCWQLCGDAHCCSFSRHKARFRRMAKTHFQELLLLPGEFGYLRQKGWLKQFGDFEHRVIRYPLEDGTLTVETVISPRANCACDHDTRPVICRLYPLLPVYDLNGAIVGTEPLAIYDELERLDHLAPACQLTALPFAELNKFLAIASEISQSPRLRFYLMAYRIAKNHVVSGLQSATGANGPSAFAAFEVAYLRNRLMDHTRLRAELQFLVRAFREKFGPQFQL